MSHTSLSTTDLSSTDLSHTKCLVSVIVRTKDRPDLLKETILSIVEQTYRPLEVVLVNDGGGDVETLAADLLKVEDELYLQYLASDTATGRSAAANRGLNAAKGTFSLFLDDDDLLDPAHISSLVIAHENTYSSGQLGAVHCVAKAMLIDEQGSRKLLSYQGEAFTKERLLYQNCLPIMTVLFNTQIREFAQFDEQFDLFEDWDFWLQVNQHCEFQFLDEQSCIYRMHNNASNVRAEQNASIAYQQVYQKWLPHCDTETLSLMLSASHSLHETNVAALQTLNQNELSRIGSLHEHALSTIQQKDQNIEQLERDYQHAISTIAEKDASIEKLSSLHQQALDVIAKKDEDVAHLSTLHSNALNVIAEKDHNAEQLASLYNEAVEYIAKLEQTLTDERSVLKQVHSELSSLQERTQALEQSKQQLEIENQHQQELLLKPWYWHFYQGMKRKKH
ncbi:glycosyltransferase family 2 protein [Marinomonas ostreistagni]|uniref:Glycosyltransferase n=1 Tax=Marinomonas ostreistagni TaxID=359209 RepID=A0ABS0ZCW6_9GAMM|nr:glycosyltransferase [Marinomonas ostreistagni]MBJ7551495.1 glycosyltransferase [Marinomonas ostreistagni]